MRVRAIRDCFVGSLRKADAEFEYSGSENRNLQPLDGTKWPARGRAAQVTKSNDDVDYGKAALFLRSRGYNAETPEAAQKFVSSFSKKDRTSFLAGLAEFEPASSSDDSDAVKGDVNVSAVERVGDPDGPGANLAEIDAAK